MCAFTVYVPVFSPHRRPLLLVHIHCSGISLPPPLHPHPPPLPPHRISVVSQDCILPRRGAQGGGGTTKTVSFLFSSLEMRDISKVDFFHHSLSPSISRFVLRGAPSTFVKRIKLITFCIEKLYSIFHIHY